MKNKMIMIVGNTENKPKAQLTRMLTLPKYFAGDFFELARHLFYEMTENYVSSKLYIGLLFEGVYI